LGERARCSLSPPKRSADWHNLNCHGAKFEGKADFSYIRVRGVTFFCDPDGKKNIPCEFKDELKFEGARFSAGVKFVEAIFTGEVIFLDCGIAETLLFGGTVPSTLTLTGCTYKRIECYYNKLWDVLGKKVGFDRSSGVQLETALRRDGDSKNADETYRKSMRKERSTLKGYRKFLSWIWDRASEYGTSQRQLAIACVLVLVAGMLVYRYLGNLEPTKEAVRYVGCKKTFETALGVSLFHFVPFTLPVGDQCKPSCGGEWFAFLQRMFGWILVPLLAANLAGMLHRKTESSPRAEGNENWTPA